MNTNLFNWMNTHREFITRDVLRTAYIVEGTDERYLLEDKAGVQEFTYDCGVFSYAHYHTDTNLDNMVKDIYVNICTFSVSNYGIFVYNVKEK